MSTGQGGKVFSTHFSAGMLTTAAALLLCVSRPRADSWALSVYGFCIVGLTHGIVVRSWRDCLLGMAASAVYLTPFFVFCAPWGSLPPYGPIEQIALGCMALFGAASPLRRRSLILIVFAGAIYSPVAIFAMAWGLSHVFPARLCDLELAEFVTILLSIPTISLLTWLPVDVSIRRAEREPD